MSSPGYGAMAEVPTIVHAVMEALDGTGPAAESYQLTDEPGTSSPRKKLKHGDDSTG